MLGCQALKALKLNVGSLATTKDMFKDATALSTLRLSGKLNTGLDLTNCPLDEDFCYICIGCQGATMVQMKKKFVSEVQLLLVT